MKNTFSKKKYLGLSIPHQINVSPAKEGDIIQFYDGKKTNVYLNKEMVNDEQMIGTDGFLRQANYMWFTMIHKLTDGGTIHEYLGQETKDGVV